MKRYSDGVSGVNRSGSLVANNGWWRCNLRIPVVQSGAHSRVPIVDKQCDVIATEDMVIKDNTVVMSKRT